MLRIPIHPQTRSKHHFRQREKKAAIRAANTTTHNDTSPPTLSGHSEHPIISAPCDVRKLFPTLFFYLRANKYYEITPPKTPSSRLASIAADGERPVLAFLSLLHASKAVRYHCIMPTFPLGWVYSSSGKKSSSFGWLREVGGVAGGCGRKGMVTQPTWSCSSPICLAEEAGREKRKA